MDKIGKRKRSRTVALNEKALGTVKSFSKQLQAVCKDAATYEKLLSHIAENLHEEIDEGLIDLSELHLDEAVRIVNQLEQNLNGAPNGKRDETQGKPRRTWSDPRTAYDLQELIDKLCESSMTDGLTGLRNRSYFHEVLSREFKRIRRVKEPCSLAIIDIDHFKKVNDAYGHHAGDFVLRELARIMLHTIRETDSLTRYGGEEFALVLPDANPARARVLAERMRARISEEVFTFRDISFSITASFGIATKTFDDSADEAELIERADVSLYVAKMEGRNRVCCFSSGTKRKRTQLSIDEKELLVST